MVSKNSIIEYGRYWIRGFHNGDYKYYLYGMWGRRVWYKFTYISEESTASIFTVEESSNQPAKNMQDPFQYYTPIYA
jgi:hypothetical protein